MPGEAGHRALPPPGTYFTGDSAKPYPEVPVLWGKGRGDRAGQGHRQAPLGVGDGAPRAATAHGNTQVCRSPTA